MTHVAPRTPTAHPHDRRATRRRDARRRALARAAGILTVLAALAAAVGGWVAVLL